jgi:hypothetical protein
MRGAPSAPTRRPAQASGHAAASSKLRNSSSRWAGPNTRAGPALPTPGRAGVRGAACRAWRIKADRFTFCRLAARSAAFRSLGSTTFHGVVRMQHAAGPAAPAKAFTKVGRTPGGCIRRDSPARPSNSGPDCCQRPVAAQRGRWRAAPAGGRIAVSSWVNIVFAPNEAVFRGRTGFALWGGPAFVLTLRRKIWEPRSSLKGRE